MRLTRSAQLNVTLLRRLEYIKTDSLDRHPDEVTLVAVQAVRLIVATAIREAASDLPDISVLRL